MRENIRNRGECLIVRKRVLAALVLSLTVCSYSAEGKLHSTEVYFSSFGDAHAARSENVREDVSTRKQRLRARKKNAVPESEDVREKTETENSRKQKPAKDTQDTHKKPEINTHSKIYQENDSSNRLIIRGY